VHSFGLAYKMLQSTVATAKPSLQTLLRGASTRSYGRSATVLGSRPHPFRTPSVPRRSLIPLLPVHHASVRPITFSAAPRLILSIGRLPLILAGGAAASVSLANSKLQGKNFNLNRNAFLLASPLIPVETLTLLPPPLRLE
jgi:hypothetical protein